MGRLIYGGIASLDGYVADEQGSFDWSMPDEEVHTFVNDRERSVGTYLYGRRLYEVMVVWEDSAAFVDEPLCVKDYASIWQGADKVVYSTTLNSVSSRRTRIERSFDADAVRSLKETSDRDVGIGGPHLAAHALRAGLVDEIWLLASPMVVGGGNRFLPDGVRIALDLLEQRRFAGGVVYLRYRTRPVG